MYDSAGQADPSISNSLSHSLPRQPRCTLDALARLYKPTPLSGLRERLKHRHASAFDIALELQINIRSEVEPLQSGEFLCPPIFLLITSEYIHLLNTLLHAIYFDLMPVDMERWR